MKKITIAIALLCVLTFLLFVPLPMTAAPDWTVAVVDGSGLPVEGITVRESYQNYSTESTGHEKDLITDSKGKVRFERVTSKQSVGGKCIGAFVSALSGGVHASYGTHAHVFAFGKGEGDAVRDGYIEDWTGSPDVYASKIVVH